VTQVELYDVPGNKYSFEQTLRAFESSSSSRATQPFWVLHSTLNIPIDDVMTNGFSYKQTIVYDCMGGDIDDDDDCDLDADGNTVSRGADVALHKHEIHYDCRQHGAHRYRGVCACVRGRSVLSTCADSYSRRYDDYMSTHFPLQ